MQCLSFHFTVVKLHAHGYYVLGRLFFLSRKRSQSPLQPSCRPPLSIWHRARPPLLVPVFMSSSGCSIVTPQVIRGEWQQQAFPGAVTSEGKLGPRAQSHKIHYDAPPSLSHSTDLSPQMAENGGCGIG